MKITKMVDKVKVILDNDELCRDNDYRLESIVYSKYFDLRETNVFDFYMKLIHSKIPNSSTIRRARRKCQELYPNTRGAKYSVRKDNQRTIKSELNEARVQSSNPRWF